MPPLVKGQERVFIYRPTSFGAIATPDIKVNDKVIGTSRGNGFVFTDLYPGKHSISIATEWTHHNTFTVQKGQPTFIECHVTPGVFIGHVLPNQISSSVGEKGIQECRLSED